MVNTEKFINRLEQILQYYDLSASVFADRIGVQRSSISHLLTGRNKPSLEFVLKVVKAFPEVNLYWLLNGKGSFPSSKESSISSILSDSATKAPITRSESQKNIQRIVIFYDDGSFESYHHSLE